MPVNSAAEVAGVAERLPENLTEEEKRPFEEKVAAALQQAKEEWRYQNVCGSTAGAGSGDFHLYRQQRRREAMRLDQMEKDLQKRLEEEEFQKRKEERKNEVESKQSKKAAKRKRMKEKQKQKRQEEKEAKKNIKANDDAPAAATNDEEPPAKKNNAAPATS